MSKDDIPNADVRSSDSPRDGDGSEERRRKARRRLLTAAGIVTSDSLME